MININKLELPIFKKTKKIIFNPYENQFSKNFIDTLEYPISKEIYLKNKESFDKNLIEVDLNKNLNLGHPGSFGYVRKNHIHEGIDLYCQENEIVLNLYDGIILDIKQFTGKAVGSDWWNDTFCILIKTENFVVNYGEVLPYENLKVGQFIKKGQEISTVKRVLKKDKGRPMDMLHLEFYDKTTKTNIDSWNLDNEKPKNLLNPDDILLNNI